MIESEEKNGYSSYDPREHRALLALSMVSGIGPGRIRQLVAQIGSARDVLDTPAEVLKEAKGISAGVAHAISGFEDYARVDAQFEWAERADATLIPYWDSRFPALLDRIYDPPAFLWVRGEIVALQDKSVAIVGTRKPSAYGLRAAAYFAEALVAHGITVVSGLAFGIDGAAHRAALEAQGKSVAVLGSGIDRIYPSKHAGLARSLMMQGAVISELPLRAKPDAMNFPRRNRIISGMTLGTLVVEAFDKGGALITARLAIEQNREVFAVPGNIFNTTAEGCHSLIRQGEAKLVHTIEDVLQELGDYVVKDVKTGTAEKKSEIDLSSLGSVERILYDALTNQPKQIDVICRNTGLDASTALVYLLSLEFKGLVYQMAGKQFYRS